MARKKNQSLEEDLKVIEDIVEQLESGELDIEEAIKIYKSGMELSKRCASRLLDIEKQVTILYKNSAGEIEEKGFESEETEEF